MNRPCKFLPNSLVHSLVPLDGIEPFELFGDHLDFDVRPVRIADGRRDLQPRRVE